MSEIIDTKDGRQIFRDDAGGLHLMGGPVAGSTNEPSARRPDKPIRAKDAIREYTRAQYPKPVEADIAIPAICAKYPHLTRTQVFNAAQQLQSADGVLDISPHGTRGPKTWVLQKIGLNGCASARREHGGGNPNHDAAGQFAVSSSEPVADCPPKAPRIKKPSLKKEGFYILESGTAAEISQDVVSAQVDAKHTAWQEYRALRSGKPCKPPTTVNSDFVFEAAFNKYGGPVEYDSVAKVIRLRPTA